MRLPKIITGGQTGVDRAAMDFAVEKKLDYGGYCPKGRIAEDGFIDKKYNLTEADSNEYSIRTKKNIIISDAVLIIIKNGVYGEGTKLTKDLCLMYDKRFLLIDIVDNQEYNIKTLKDFILDVSVLNVAGNRESTSPGIYESTFRFLRELDKDLI